MAVCHVSYCSSYYFQATDYRIIFSSFMQHLAADIFCEVSMLSVPSVYEVP